MCIYFENEGIVLNDMELLILIGFVKQASAILSDMIPICTVCFYVLYVSLLSFCLAKNESSKEKGDFFQLLRMKKEALLC